MWILKPPGFDADEEMAARLSRPRRAAGRVGGRLELPLEPAGVGGPGLRRRPAQSARLDRLRPEIRRRNLRRLGRQVLRGPDGGLAYLEKQPYIDKRPHGRGRRVVRRLHDELVRRQHGKFKTLITHCGVWNFDSMYATTEEVWFDEWEHGGPPWGKNRESYEKHSPHRFAANLGKFKTPMLIIHNDLDFRCPVGQGIELFTTLQRQGVPSRFINFPDEGPLGAEAGQQRALAQGGVRLAQEVRPARRQVNSRPHRLRLGTIAHRRRSVSQLQ